MPAQPSSSTQTAINIRQAHIRPSGTPWIRLSSGASYAYNGDFQAWEEMCNTWLAESSPVWTRTRGTANKNIVTGLETELNALQPNLTQDVTGGKPRWWNDAMTLGHLEIRMRAAVLLDSAAEYKSFLLLYAKKIADEGYKSKGEELVRELYGPVYYNASNERNWTPTVCGMSKKDLLREVLSIFGKTQSLGEIAQVWQDRLKASLRET